MGHRLLRELHLASLPKELSVTVLFIVVFLLFAIRLLWCSAILETPSTNNQLVPLRANPVECELGLLNCRWMW